MTSPPRSGGRRTSSHEVRTRAERFHEDATASEVTARRRRGARLQNGARVSRPRFPRSVYEVGAEPDPRFTLANERTFLAWIRTALALIAAGVALEALALPLHPGLRMGAAVLLLLIGLAVPVLSWFTWGAVERALRQGAPLPGSKVAFPVAVAVSAAAALILLGLLLR